MTPTEIIELDKELLESYKLCLNPTCIADVKSNFLHKWEKIKNNEEALSAALKTTSGHNVNFTAPTIISLILMDYKNVDKLAYDVVIRKIYYTFNLGRNSNPLLTEYGYSYLVTSLFNTELLLSHDKKKMLKDEFCRHYFFHTNKTIAYTLYWLYNHPSITEEEKNKWKVFEEYEEYDLYNLLENYDELIKLRRIKTLPF